MISLAVEAILPTFMTIFVTAAIDSINPCAIGVLILMISVLLAGKTKNATDAGLKPFVYSKSKQMVEKTGLSHFEMLSRHLVATYHQARAGEGELELGLEKLLLEKV